MSQPVALIQCHPDGATRQPPRPARDPTFHVTPTFGPAIEPPDNAAVVPPALFFEHLDAATRSRTPSLALLVVDIDGFHTVNETFGFLTGDRFLEAVSRRLALQLRAEDFVTRIGGDEFAVLLLDIGSTGSAIAIARHVLAGLRHPFLLDGRAHASTARAGVVVCPTHGRDTRTLLHGARAALRIAKTTAVDVATAPGPGHLSAAPAPLPEPDSEAGRELRSGLLRGEFKVHYQPIHNFQSGRVEAFEALVRWRHPTRGLLAPDRFLPQAEQAGLARAIGVRVLDSACASLRGWRATGHPQLRVAVNLSAQDFHDDDFAHSVTSTLARHALPPSALELELTEHELLHDDRAVAQATELARQGVALSIDDFGTKYSSLAYLHRLPVRAIKVDRSFVRDVGQSTASNSIVSAVITIAGKMGLRLVAEGVEEVRQMQELRRLGCHIMQGYLFSPPVPAVAVDAYLARTTHVI